MTALISAGRGEIALRSCAAGDRKRNLVEMEKCG